jgi:hypothetical protein
MLMNEDKIATKIAREIMAKSFTSSRRADDFFAESKHGKAIDKMLRGKWNTKKVDNYLDSIHPDNVIRWGRVMGQLETRMGIRVPDSANGSEQVKAILKSMEPLYKEFNK